MQDKVREDEGAFTSTRGTYATQNNTALVMSAFNSSPGDKRDVDHEIRIEKMKRELQQLGDEQFVSGGFEEVPPELEETFLERVSEFEKAELDTNFDRLVRRGVEMVPPAELDDSTLDAKLHEVLQPLAEMHCFLHDTDHLSDRELYAWLWTDGLREETPDVAELEGNWHTSPSGSCTDEDTAIFLRYYASEKERRRWNPISRTIRCRHIVRGLTTGTKICCGRGNWVCLSMVPSPTGQRSVLPRKKTQHFD